MRKYVSLVTGLILSFSLIHQASGDIVLSLSNELDDAGESVDVIVSIADTGGGSILTNFNIPIDVGSDNAFTPEGGQISFIGVTSLSDFTELALTPFPPGNFDFALADSGAALSLTSTPTELFSLNFAIDPLSDPGLELPVSIQTNPSVAGSPFPGLLTLTLDGDPVESNDPGFVNFGITSGSVTVAGVPEPGSAALMLAALGGLALCRRRAR